MNLLSCSTYLLVLRHDIKKWKLFYLSINVSIKGYKGDKCPEYHVFTQLLFVLFNVDVFKKK